jgi:DNA-nicking Smr family endonuclease
VTRGQKTLTEDDRILWNLVEKSTKPMHPRKVQKALPELSASVEATNPSTKPGPGMLASPQTAKPSSMPSYTPPVSKPRPPSHLDQPTLDNLAKGRLPIEARVDLHGMTQDEAYALLYSFLSRAYAGGARYVLVITGKGSSSGGDGVLKRSVPGWLATPLFRQFVSSHDPAARGHGGSGALYVRLRRR